LQTVVDFPPPKNKNSGDQAVRQALPDSFNWPLSGLALILLAVPIPDMGWQLHLKKPAD